MPVVFYFSFLICISEGPVLWSFCFVSFYNVSSHKIKLKKKNNGYAFFMLLVIVLNYQKYKSVRQNNNYTINKLNLYIYKTQSSIYIFNCLLVN
jgi:hypothetical protein